MRLRNAVLYTKDIEKSKKFYISLGFEVVDDFGKFVSFKTDDAGVTLAINLADEPAKVAGNQTVIFSVNEIRSEYERLKRMNVAIKQDLYEAPFGLTFSFLDPDGNKIEFVES